jgi:hypothetical protein
MLAMTKARRGKRTGRGAEDRSLKSRTPKERCKGRMSRVVETGEWQRASAVECPLIGPIALSLNGGIPDPSPRFTGWDRPPTPVHLGIGQGGVSRTRAERSGASNCLH